MWCDNCFLLFPLRAGAISLGVIMTMYQIVGGALLFTYGDFFFFHLNESSIYGGYAFAQAAMSIIAVIAFSMRSETFANFNLRVYPIIIILGLTRGIIMAWSLDHYKDRITWECDHGVTDDRILPVKFCDNDLKTLIALFSMFLIVDFGLMCYFYFMIWRFVVKLQHYPFQGKFSFS
ncbi:9638_t:CDS:2 [Diversispora eburnea]|uniref:9638_t:CDS:1 n=1 Tax=Diversispora eburnea TaxID=1213867 RepID=A0A9N9BMZ8_9GLOM|nr:9638_t:CDS:2 [Diversispora eburnea]